VVEGGTARRIHGAFVGTDSVPLVVGGKTGSGDNRQDKFDRRGRTIASRPVSRTATFVFYIGPKHFGVVTASVMGRRSGDYSFTSSLPLAVLRLLAPAIQQSIHPDASLADDQRPGPARSAVRLPGPPPPAPAAGVVRRTGTTRPAVSG
jgi:hypothetical protein